MDSRHGLDVKMPQALQGDPFISAYSYHRMLREAHIETRGFVIITDALLDRLTQLLKGSIVADVGCGTAYLTKLLEDQGVNIVGIDRSELHYGFKCRHTSIVEGDATEMDLSGYNVILLSWPCYSTDFASKIAGNMKVGQKLLYQGEGTHGCTGDEAFHEMLETDFEHDEVCSAYLNAVHKTFEGLWDRWHLYVKLEVKGGTQSSNSN